MICNLMLLFLSIFGSSCVFNTRNQVAMAVETRPGAIEKSMKSSSRNEPRPRVIGGTTATNGRFPYFASLLNHHGQRSCGGILIAPDIVMTAAHCSNIKFAQVGRWSLGDELDGYEEFQVDATAYPHPLYNSGTSYSHDAMLFKLDRQSTKQYIHLNENPEVPSSSTSTVRNSLTVVGFGYTKYGSSNSEPDFLQEASLSYVPNHVCARSKDPDAPDSYEGLISDDMMCASDHGEDACQGKKREPSAVVSDYCWRIIEDNPRIFSQVIQGVHLS